MKHTEEFKENLSKRMEGNKYREGKVPYNKGIGRTARQRNRDNYLKRRVWLDDLKNAPCMDCGNNFPSECMDFDHREDEEKLFEIHNIVMSSLEVILTEIKKCDLICSNCHRIRTRKSIRLRKRRKEN